ncbi:MAG: hypothetical protein ACREK5_08460 [Gemmatimonadota bacterium]
MVLRPDGFDPATPLPPGLKIAHIREAIAFVEERADEFVDVYFEQANVFSALVGIFGIRALDSLSPYKKHKHPDVAQQRFPDMSLDGRLNPPPPQALESKASIRPWALQSHYNHPGWYIVWRYAVDPTRRMKPGKAVPIWRVDIPFVTADDWKYEGSKAGEGRGGRTHTFGVRNPKALLSRAVVYQAPEIVLYRGKAMLANGERRVRLVAEHPPEPEDSN